MLNVEPALYSKDRCTLDRNLETDKKKKERKKKKPQILNSAHAVNTSPKTEAGLWHAAFCRGGLRNTAHLTDRPLCFAIVHQDLESGCAVTGPTSLRMLPCRALLPGCEKSEQWRSHVWVPWSTLPAEPSLQFMPAQKQPGRDSKSPPSCTSAGPLQRPSLPWSGGGKISSVPCHIGHS